ADNLNNTTKMLRVHCTVPETRTTTTPHPGWPTPTKGVRTVLVEPDNVTAVIASGKRPVTFRTRKLSLTAPMVLHRGRCGRVGHRRTTIAKGPPGTIQAGLWHARISAGGRGQCAPW